LQVIARHLSEDASHREFFASSGFAGSDKGRAKRRQPNKVEGSKVSMMFRIYDKPGALIDLLKVFLRHEISLTRIESKPTTGS